MMSPIITDVPRATPRVEVSHRSGGTRRTAGSRRVVTAVGIIKRAYETGRKSANGFNKIMKMVFVRLLPE
jgi:hypothetical protein